MPLVPINNLGSVGIIKDIPPYGLPDNAWSNGNNVRFLNDGVKKIRGYTEVMATCPFAPHYIMPFEDFSGDYFWVAFGLTAAAVWDQTTWTDITRQRTGQLNGALTATATTIVLDDSSFFPSAGKIAIGTNETSELTTNLYEEITYTTNNTGTNTLGGLTVANDHLDNEVVTPIETTATSDVAYNATATENWRATVLNGLLVATNGYDTAQMWPLINGEASATTPLRELKNWQSTSSYCKSISAFRTFLVGLNWTIGGDDFPNLVKWSTEANAAQPPASWVETDLELDTGEYQLTDTPGKIIDGLPFKDSFFIYKNDSIYAMNYVGTPYVFGFKLLSPTVGLLTKNAIAEFDMGHFFMGNSDFYLNDGQTVRPLLPDKLRRAVFDVINAGDTSNPSWKKCFVVADHLHTEMLACYPTDASTIVNKAVIWNWRTGTFSFRDLPDTTHISSGIAPVFPTGNKWGPAATLDESSMTPSAPATGGNLTVVTTTSTPAFSTAGTLIINGSGSTPDGLGDIGAEQITYTGKTGTTFTNITRGANSTIATAHPDASMVNEVESTWDSNSNAWGSSAYDTHLENLVFADVTNTKLYRDNNGNQEDTTDMTSYIERSGYDLGDPSTVKFVSAVYPEVDVSGSSPVQVWVGHQMSTDAGVTWEGPTLFNPDSQSKVSCRVAGKYFGIRVQSTTDIDWKLHGVSFEVRSAGKRGSRMQV